MRNFFRSYFQFNRRELHGLLFLAGLFFLVTILKWVLLNSIENSLPEMKVQAISELSQTVEKSRSFWTKKQVGTHDRSLFYFDPNSLNAAGWKRLGLSAKQQQSVLNYRLRGGIFKSANDLGKLYCLNESLLTRLKPFVRIDSAALPVTTVESVKYGTVGSVPLVDINSADSLQLLEIKGIGPYFASAILRYRKRLGGYVHKEQLLEIYHFEAEKYALVKAKIWVDSTRITKINLNAVDEKLNHPYLDSRRAKALANYRKQHGKFQQIEQLRQTDLLDDERYRKIVPYLTLTEH